MKDPKWLEEDKAMVSAAPKDGMTQMYEGWSVAARAHAHIDELRDVLDKANYCANHVGDGCNNCDRYGGDRCLEGWADFILDRQAPPEVE
jgi:hypothetical protein